MEEFIYKHSCKGIDWEKVHSLLCSVGLSDSTINSHQQAFLNSCEVVFVFADKERLIGCGRAISDRVRQAAIYDIAVDSEYQGRGLGRKIIECLMERLQGCNFILYASAGKENFYRKCGFLKMKTGMVLFSDSERMKDVSLVEE